MIKFQDFCNLHFFQITCLHVANILVTQYIVEFFSPINIYMLEMIHFTGDIYENFDPHLLLLFCP